jgi:hypothetical protein
MNTDSCASRAASSGRADRPASTSRSTPFTARLWIASATSAPRRSMVAWLPSMSVRYQVGPARRATARTMRARAAGVR